MILADAATTVLPGAEGLWQLGLIAGGIGFLVLFLLPSDKGKDGWNLPSLTTWAFSKRSNKGPGEPAVEPTVGEAYELFTRLKLLSPGRVADYGHHLDESCKHLTWLKDSAGGDSAAP